MTQKIHFATLIQAPLERVWDTMLALKTYEDWTSAFSPGSTYEGSWDQGAEIRFLGPDGASGMAARIAENRRHAFISIEHLGMIDKGVVDNTSEAVRAWLPAFENYSFSALGPNETELRVDMDITADFEEHMQRTWPQALARLKVLCEAA